MIIPKYVETNGTKIYLEINSYRDHIYDRYGVNYHDMNLYDCIHCSFNDTILMKVHKRLTPWYKFEYCIKSKFTDLFYNKKDIIHFNNRTYMRRNND